MSRLIKIIYKNLKENFSFKIIQIYYLIHSRNFIQAPLLVHGAKEPLCAAPPASCLKSRYRTLDGTCNNLQNPAWGAANMRYNRLLTPKYADGISAPTASVTGQELPNARVVSLVVFGEQDVPDPQFTLANMQWGQIITHDMSMQAGSTQSKKHQTRCCTDEGKLIGKPQAHKTCFPIIVPKNDPAFTQVIFSIYNYNWIFSNRFTLLFRSEQNVSISFVLSLISI